MIGFYGSSRTPRRASACYINMTFLIDGGVTSSNTAFALIQKESNSNLTGTKRLFLNEYDLIVKNPSGDGIEDVSIIGFLKKGAGGDVTHETALDFSEKYRSHAYDTNRYGVVSDDNFANAGQNIETRLDDNFSLDGEEELVTNSDGDTIVSGETDITRLQFRVVEIAFNGTTAGFDRTNFSEHKIRISKYGKIGQDIDIPVGFDTNDNAANRIQNLVMVDDARITEPVKSTVAAYATLTNLNEFYDYIRHLEFENRKDPNLRRISFDGKSITFPSNSTIDVDTSQTDPITVSYSSADSTVFTLKNDSQITVPGNNNLNSLDLGTDGTVDSDADFATSVGIIDSSGLSVVLNCNIASVKIHYQIDPDDDGSDDIEGYVTADSSGNYKLTGIPSESHVYVAAKKDGYDYFVTDFDPAVTISKSLILSLTQSVDLSVSVSDYTFDSGATDSDNNIFFEYDGAGKSNIIFGEIDLDPATNARKLSNRVFDHLFETEDGLKFINFWNRDNSITELDGRPYLISNGKISINNTKLEFTRMSGMTAAEKSYFGQYVSDEEDDRYRAPQSNNDNVSIASESNVIESSIGTLEDAAVFIRKEMDDNSTKLEEILEDVSNPVFEHLYVVDNDVHRVLGYDIASKKLNPSIGFDLHTDNENPQGMTNYNGLFYLLNAPATGTQKILVYTSRGNRLEYREFELHADNDSPEAIAIAGEKIYILDGGSTKKIFVYDATTLQRLSGDDIDDLSSIENPQGMDVHGEYAYVSDSRNNIDTTRRLRVYKLSDGVLDTAKSFNLNSNQELPTGVVVTNSRIRIVDENRNKIFVYLHDGTHISSEDITLDPTNTDARGMAIISSSVNDIATLEADFAGLKTSIDGIFDDAEFIRKMQSSDVEVTDSQIIFSYEGTTLLTFNRRTSTTAADYSGGREIDSS